MAKFRTVQASFVSGELAPTARGRFDTSIYSKSADKLRNVYVRPQGGVFRREGLEYISNTSGNAEARIIPFEFNDEQTYLLVFSPGLFQVFKSGDSSVQATVSSSPISGLDADTIKEMNYTQSADTLIIVHRNLQPIKITRTSDTSWTATSLTLENIPPYAFGSLTTATPSGNITPDVKTGRVTVTGSGTTFTADIAVGQFINMPKGGRIYIRSVASDTEFEGDVVIELAETTAVTSGDWEYESGYEDVISATRGWPRAVAFYKSRLILAGLKERPSTLLMSVVGDFFNFDEGSGLDDEAINITIDDDKVNIIQNVFPGRSLQIFTTGGEYTFRSAINDPLTPSTVSSQLNNDTRHGSGNLDSSNPRRVPRPISVDGATVFIERGGAVARQFVFNETEDSFNGTNISILSPHLINDPVAMDIRRANTTHPADFLYVVNSDGTCAVLNSLREQDLLAWSLFETEGTFEDVAVTGNEVYFIVKRNINGVDVRHVEKLNPEHLMDASYREVQGSPTTSWSGFAYLNGEECTVRGDAFVLADATPSGGGITTDEAVSDFEIGLPFFARVKSLPIELIVQGQSFAGRYKSLASVNILLHESRNIDVIKGSNTYKPAFRQFGNNVLDQAVPTFSGWKKVYLGGIGRDADVEVTQAEPLEFNVLAMHYEVRV